MFYKFSNFSNKMFVQVVSILSVLFWQHRNVKFSNCIHNFVGEMFGVFLFYFLEEPLIFLFVYSVGWWGVVGVSKGLVISA